MLLRLRGVPHEEQNTYSTKRDAHVSCACTTKLLYDSDDAWREHPWHRTHGITEADDGTSFFLPPSLENQAEHADTDVRGSHSQQGQEHQQDGDIGGQGDSEDR